MGRKWSEPLEFVGFRRNYHANFGSSSGKSGFTHSKPARFSFRTLSRPHFNRLLRRDEEFGMRDLAGSLGGTETGVWCHVP